MDDALQITSELSQDRVLGILLREMSVPSLLPIQMEAIIRRDPDNINRLMFIKGDPGSGKTHLAKMVGRIRSEKGPLVVDCADRNISELLFETTLDVGEDFKTGLNSKLASKAVTAASRTELRKLGPAYVEAADGSAQIDWPSVGMAHEGKQSDSQAAEQAYEVLKRVHFLEGFDTAGANVLGMKMNKGPLIRAFEEDREIILDEYNKSVQGTDGAMQSVLQFLVGMDRSATVSNRLKIDGREETYSFEFKRENMGAGFFVTITGNDTKDGVTTHELSASAYSRIDPFQVPPMQLVDWKHRISQYLTGLPLSTLLAVYHGEAEKNPDTFTQTLMTMRTLGMTETEQAAIPSHHLLYLQNWQGTAQAVDMLANFYVKWAQMVDPDSIAFDPSISAQASELQPILNEISPRYRDEVSIDFRQPIHDFNRALKQRPKVQALSPVLRFSASSRTALHATAPVEVAEGFGARLEKILLERIAMTTPNMPALQEQLLQTAEDCGILPRKLQEAKESEQPQTLASLLNVDRWKPYGGGATLRVLQQEIMETLGGSAVPPSLDDLSMAVDRVRMLDGSKSQVVIVPHAKPSDASRTPFAGLAVVDQANLPAAMKKEELLPVNKLLNALALPLLGEKNLIALRSRGISASGQAPEDAPAVQIAEGRSESGYVMTTVGTANSPPVHIVVDGKRNRKLLVAAAVPSELMNTLGAAGYKVVVQDTQSAQAEIEKFLEPATKEDKIVPQLRQAYLLRNGDESTQETLSALLAKSSVPAFIPVYATNRIKMEI
jgi:MoxR-like ATPase